MSYTALYRKWRPTGFDEVRGQDAIVKTLKNQIMSGRVGHAYLFCGTRGTGKTSIAKIFAKAVNCAHPEEGSPCGLCAMCQQIAAGASLNVVEIDAASNNGVENIREIREQVQYPPTDGRYRVYIIDEVHMLSIGAFNALLKTLEEPPSYVIFILATTEVHKIPITILSRCQRYDFKRISTDTIAAHLQELTKAEQLEAEEKALRYVAKAADGSMRDALSLLDQCAAFHFGERLTYDHVLEILGAADYSVFSQLFRAVQEKETKTCMAVLEDLIQQGRDLSQLVTDFIWYLRNLLLVKATGDAEEMLDLSEDHLARLREEAAGAQEETLMRYIRIFSELSGQLRLASQKRVLVEVALIKLTRPMMEQNLDSVLQRLHDIEQKLQELPSDLDRLAALAASGGLAGREVQMGKEGISPENAAAAEAGGTEPVPLPNAQYEDLMLIRKEWSQLGRMLGGANRAALQAASVEPAGESSLCVVCPDEGTFSIVSRESVLSALTQAVEEKYKKTIEFKARLEDFGRPASTVYVSEEELKQAIHMEITIEEE